MVWSLPTSSIDVSQNLRGERVFTQNSRQINGVGSAPSVSLPPVHAVGQTRLRRNVISRIIKDASRPHSQTGIAQTERIRGHVIITADRHTAWRQNLFAFSDAIRAEHERARQRRSHPVSAKECSVRRMTKRSSIESCDFLTRHLDRASIHREPPDEILLLRQHLFVEYLSLRAHR
jgi:hypothetical protein